jgi:hypothetical protein
MFSFFVCLAGNCIVFTDHSNMLVVLNKKQQAFEVPNYHN